MALIKSLFVTAFVIISLSGFSQSYVPELNNSKIKVKPEIPIKAFAFNVRDVKLLEGSPFKNAMDKDAAYLLVLEPDRLLHRFHKNADLKAALISMNLNVL